jgi:hypothetical protein
VPGEPQFTPIDACFLKQHAMFIVRAFLDDQNRDRAIAILSVTVQHRPHDVDGVVIPERESLDATKVFLVKFAHVTRLKSRTSFHSTLLFSWKCFDSIANRFGPKTSQQHIVELIESENESFVAFLKVANPPGTLINTMIVGHDTLHVVCI